MDQWGKARKLIAALWLRINGETGNRKQDVDSESLQR